MTPKMRRLPTLKLIMVDQPSAVPTERVLMPIAAPMTPPPTHTLLHTNAIFKADCACFAISRFPGDSLGRGARKKFSAKTMPRGINIKKSGNTITGRLMAAAIELILIILTMLLSSVSNEISKPASKPIKLPAIAHFATEKFDRRSARASNPHRIPAYIQLPRGDPMSRYANQPIDKARALTRIHVNKKRTW